MTRPRPVLITTLVVVALLAMTVLLIGSDIGVGDSITPPPATPKGMAGDDATGLDPDRPAGTTARKEIAVHDGPAGNAVVLDGVDGEPIPGLDIEGRDDSGHRLSVRSGPEGIFALPPGSWQLETPSKRYRLEGDRTVVDPEETGIIVWATQIPSARLRVVGLGGLPVAQATITVLASPLQGHFLTHTFVTDEEGFVSDEEGFEEIRPEGLSLSISHPLFDLKDLVLRRSVGDEVHEVFLHPSRRVPQVITCVDQAGVPMEGVRVHASLAKRRFHFNEMQIGLTDAAGQLSVPAWAMRAGVRLTFGGSACPSTIEPRLDACKVYRLVRACPVAFQVQDWQPGMSVVWGRKITARPAPDECQATAYVENLVNGGKGRFAATLPMGLPVELTCRDSGLREWNAVVTARTPGQTFDVRLWRPKARRLNLVAKGGAIGEVTVTARPEDENHGRRIEKMAMAFSRQGAEASFMVPTDECTVYLVSTAGAKARLQGKPGDQDVTMTVTFEDTHRVDFAVVDQDGQPISDVVLHVSEALRKWVSSERKDGWRQWDNWGGNNFRVQPTRAGTASLDIEPGSYEVKIHPLPWRWRHSLPYEDLPIEGRTFEVTTEGGDVDVRVVTKRPRCLTFELMANGHADIPQVWRLRHAASDESRKLYGRIGRIWTTAAGGRWEIRSGNSLLGSVEVPESPRAWSGQVWIK